jgi:D-alanyl-lipoteichoic acid biosynthesis protein DltB
MLIFSILVMCLAALGSWIFRGQRANILLVVSIFALYALQAGSGVFDLILPTATLLMAVGVWWILTPVAHESDIRTLLLIIFLVFLIPIITVIGGLSFSAAIRPLPVLGLVGGGAFFAGLSLPGEAAQSDVRKRVASGYIVVIIVLLVILKLPALQIAVTTAIFPTAPIAWGWLGFSYIAFRLMHILLDYRSGRLKSAGLRDLLLYTIFFPALSAGPIDRIEHFTKELTTPRQLDAERLFRGSQRVVIGLFKKFVIADSLAYIALSPALASQVSGVGYVWVTVYAYAFRIFFDFAGYSDIAIGIGILAGIDLPENFTSPYTKRNIQAFWNSWHITLSTWFRAYFFTPFSRDLMRSPLKNSRTLIVLIAQIATMVLIGLWHGIAINFVLWGVYHGVGLWLHRWYTDQPFTKAWDARVATQPVLARLIHGLSVLLTFHFVAIGWIFFALPDLTLIGRTLGGLVGLHG